MSHRYTIRVEQADIDEGVRGQSAHCIHATAIGRQILDATRIEVDAQTVRFTIGNERLVYMSPRAVAAYVLAFDDGDYGRIAPVTYELSNPQIKPRKKAGATRLTVKGESSQSVGASAVPTRTRAFGLRTFRVNQKPAGERIKVGEAPKAGEFGRSR